MFIDQSLVQQTVYTNQDIETLSQKKVPGKAYKNIYMIYTIWLLPRLRLYTFNWGRRIL